MIGQQINFFFSPIDENIFLKEIHRRSDLIVTDKNEIVKSVDSSLLNNNSIFQVWIKKPSSKVYTTDKFISVDPRSEIIEYSRSISDSFFKRPTFHSKRINKDKRILEPGRIWAAMSYFDKEDKANKEKWFKDWFESYAKWIKNYCIKSNSIYKDYIGKDAYSGYKEGKYLIPDYYTWD
jgi:hypothetical protein